ncbi:hypothetical protein HHI36_002111 [Cryptolaemus montrouzieri]|uniref:Uncharacterized protein n=1 Tax=Cryptolaemus montrouzieri TaxID=559131 RepID=A0ABD2PA68_9CUCU
MPPHLLADASVSSTSIQVASPTDSSAPAKVSSPCQYPPVTSTTPHTPLTSPPASSYPAILVGRPTVENKPKVPPPVPPRGTPKTKRGGIAGKGLHSHCFGHEKHASTPVVAVKASSVCSSESYSSFSSASNGAETVPRKNIIEKLKIELDSRKAKTTSSSYKRYAVSSKAKIFNDLFEARRKILGEHFDDNLNDTNVPPIHSELPAYPHFSLRKIDNRIFYEMEDYV